MSIHAVGVVVPAHNEEALLPYALASLQVAAAHPALAGIEVHVLTVLDGCTDGSALVGGSATISIDARNVGVARRAGFTELLARSAQLPADQVWLTTTDADTTVPSDWLAVQLELAAAGAEAVVGTVRVVDWTEQPAITRARFDATYGRPADGHRHVHGANLGVRADAYLDVGGMPELAVSEDVALVAALRHADCGVVSTGRIPVVTSARRESRVTGGFAHHLERIAGRTAV